MSKVYLTDEVLLEKIRKIANRDVLGVIPVGGRLDMLSDIQKLLSENERPLVASEARNVYHIIDDRKKIIDYVSIILMPNGFDAKVDGLRVIVSGLSDSSPETAIKAYKIAKYERELKPRKNPEDCLEIDVRL